MDCPYRIFWSKDESTFRAELNTASISILNITHPTSPTTSATSHNSNNRARTTSISSSLGGLRLDNVGIPQEGNEEEENNNNNNRLGNWINGKEVPHGSPILDQDLANAEAIDDGFTGTGPTDQVTTELQALYSSFQRCIDLREKYMKLSRQRLEDNPANYDGLYSGTPRSASNLPLPSDEEVPLTPSPQFKPWEIYPPPPSPHWKERDPYSESTETTEEIEEREGKRRAFSWEKVTIPGKEIIGKRKKYEIDGNGVYQVFNEGKSFELWSYCFELITDHFLYR